MLNLSIRQEMKSDYEEVESIIRSAFTLSDLGYSGEAELVAKLRDSKAFIPELSLVGLVEGKLVAHILLTRVQIINTKRSIPALSLAPVSVLPEFQGKGIGGNLIQAAHKKAEKLKEKYIVVLGHRDYYPRFGYEQCKNYGISLPFSAPDESCMVYVMDPEDSEDISGEVEFDSAFME